MTTYHGADGRFTSPQRAHTAVRDGERLKVVRQLRRLKRSKKEDVARDRALRTVLRSHLAKSKAAMMGELSAPGFINIFEALDK